MRLCLDRGGQSARREGAVGEAANDRGARRGGVGLKWSEQRVVNRKLSRLSLLLLLTLRYSLLTEGGLNETNCHRSCRRRQPWQQRAGPGGQGGRQPALYRYRGGDCAADGSRPRTLPQAQR